MSVAIRTRPASQMVQPYASRSAVRVYMLLKKPDDGAANTDRFATTTSPHY